SNPPYVSAADYEKVDAWVKAEPEIALFGGEEGMDYLSVVVEGSLSFLKEGGFLAVEIGYDQSLKVRSCFEKCGFKNVRGFRDPGGYDRVISGWKNG
ncbi:MAG: peptide chain release factor N(5)-glutamine methyltransferase, partial [Candidatus Omnitrophota bacterium]